MKAPSHGSCMYICRHQRFSKEPFLPSKCIPPSNQLCLTDLPEELILIMLKGLPLLDLMKMRSVCRYFHDLINNNSCLWASASLHSIWPSQKNLHCINKAASHGNVEALIKLGVAYLYSEGLTTDYNGEYTAKLFLEAEKLTPSIPAFTWLFYRPPWSPYGSCCKAKVFHSLTEFTKKANCDKSVYYCIGRTLSFFDDEKQKAESLNWYRHAADIGCPHSAFALWNSKHQFSVIDKGSELESIRSLRDLATSHPECLEAQLSLCEMYVSGKRGGLSFTSAASFVRDLFQSSQATKIANIFKVNNDFTPRMRHILMDWLVEVTGMKDFHNLTFHITMQAVDRFLMAVRSNKSQLQLLGITALVLCTRYLGQDILTVREAAWLTDNTYKYEDVVRMMGQIVATLKGNLRVITVLDYLEILLKLTSAESSVVYFSHYLSELSLLHPEFGDFPQALVAASCLLLARINFKEAVPWMNSLLQFTGFSVEDCKACVALLHYKCSTMEELVDLRSQKLVAICQKYKEEKFCSVSELQIVTAFELQQALNISEEALEDLLKPYKLESTLNGHLNAVEETSIEDAVNSNVSLYSGYEGDEEPDTLSDSCDNLDFEGPGLISLWCSELDNPKSISKNQNLSGDESNVNFTSCSSPANKMYFHESLMPFEDAADRTSGFEFQNSRSSIEKRFIRLSVFDNCDIEQIPSNSSISLLNLQHFCNSLLNHKSKPKEGEDKSAFVEGSTYITALSEIDPKTNESSHPITGYGVSSNADSGLDFPNEVSPLGSLSFESRSSEPFSTSLSSPACEELRPKLHSNSSFSHFVGESPIELTWNNCLNLESMSCAKVNQEYEAEAQFFVPLLNRSNNYENCNGNGLSSSVNKLATFDVNSDKASSSNKQDSCDTYNSRTASNKENAILKVSNFSSSQYEGPSSSSLCHKRSRQQFAQENMFPKTETEQKKKRRDLFVDRTVIILGEKNYS